jgi:LmbE family N-acetylglucosaminyl deacetylase
MLGVEEADWALERAHPLTVSPGSVDAVSGWLIRFRPDVVFVPHEKEQDPDHAMVSQVVRSAMLHSGCVRPILGYEVWMPISRPALFEDVTSVLAAKKGAIGRFASQTRDRDYVAGSVGLNRFRGVMSGNGDYVEVFNLVGM